MEPTTLIITALATGVTAGISSTATEAIKDSYNSLKVLIKNKFLKNDKSESSVILQKYEEKPIEWEKRLRESLIEIEAHKDEEIIQTAQKLINLEENQQTSIGKYNVQINGGNVQGLIQGDNANISINFDGTKK